VKELNNKVLLNHFTVFFNRLVKESMVKKGIQKLKLSVKCQTYL